MGKRGTKICPRCGGEKDREGKSYCIGCERAKRIEWNLANPEKVRESLRKSRIKSRGWKRTMAEISEAAMFCSKCGAERGALKKSHSTMCRACQTAAKRAKYAMDVAYRMKEISRRLTSYYVKTGRIVRKPCEVCGNERSQAHHEDYAKPLEVRWLCQKHHQAEHRRLSEQAQESLIAPRIDASRPQAMGVA